MYVLQFLYETRNLANQTKKIQFVYIKIVI